MKTRHVSLIIAATAAVLVASHGASLAQMADPTRPPAELATSSEGQGGLPVLQSIVTTGNARWALIDGKRVEQGGRYRDAHVVSITESEVTLRSARGTEVLKLHPDVRITSAKTAQPAPARPPRARN